MANRLLDILLECFWNKDVVPPGQYQVIETEQTSEKDTKAQKYVGYIPASECIEAFPG